MPTTCKVRRFRVSNPSNGPLGPSALGSDGPLGPSPLGSNWILTEWQIAVLNYFDGTWVKESSANTKAISH